MQFNSPDYLFFFIIVFFVFWFLVQKHLLLQNIFLLVISYVFYAWWDWRFLFLIIFISLVNYFVSIQISKTGDLKKRRFFLLFSIITNLGLLGFFKYFNFFIQSASDLLNIFGIKADFVTLNIILPIGISFYSLQTLGYTLDVYTSKYEPTKNVIAFFAFVSFFPLLLAGPIERGDTLLPQFFKKRKFDYYEAVNGLRQILWGLFKKIVIADNCAILVNQIFGNYESQSVSVLIMGLVYFAFQIYGDFSGYSDIAIGSAKLLGFNLTINFKTPYFSRDIAEFWRRWHISLSNWLRDYLFIPLNLQLRYYGSLGSIISVIITFLICGFWHGADWTFIIWGGLNGVYFIPIILTNKDSKILNVVPAQKFLPSIKEIVQIIITFFITCFAWIFFKAPNIHTAINYIYEIFTRRFFPNDAQFFPRYILFLIFFLLLSEWFLLRYDDYFDRFSRLTPILRNVLYAFTLVLLFLFIQNEATTFIYFQF